MSYPVKIVPTEGGYQKHLKGEVVYETKTMYHVQIDGQGYLWKFSKKDMLRTGEKKNEFPRHRLDIRGES